MRIIFVRHGEPDYKNDCLTAEGHIQAEAVAKRLANEKIEGIYEALKQVEKFADLMAQEKKKLIQEKLIQQDTVIAQQKRLDRNKQIISEKEIEIKNLQEQCRDKENENHELKNKIKKLYEENDKLNNVIKERENEIQKRSQALHAIHLDTESKSNEQFNRLSSKLKIEYRDFKDAENLAMSIDLGENMREQLKNIFRILDKSGITLQ